MKSLLAAGTVLIALAGPAFASECPTLIQKAEEALNTTSLDEATKNKVMEHIAQAKSEHEAGQHTASLVTLKDTMQLLGM